MASSKRPTYIVETKLATERKRRKSDLVIMWQSIWDVTSIIVKELWITLLRMWELIQLWFSSSERFEIQAWLEKYLPFVPDDFSDSWRDGRLLAVLLDKLQPGCFPDAHHLDPDYGLRNVYKAFGVLEVYFGIKPSISVEEIVTCIEGSDSQLFGILLDLRRLTENQPENEDPPEAEPKENNEQHHINQSCIAKGTGLAVGFVGRITNFIIFCATISDLDAIVEIRGPNTICSERITKRSPKKKRSVSAWEYPRFLTRSASFNEERYSLMTEEGDNLEKRIISLEYEIIGNQISVGYRPKEVGQHKVSILWHGQHVSDSPYFVAVEDPSKIAMTSSVVNRKSALKTANESEKSESRKNSVRFQESQVRYKEESKPSGRVLSRRVLRYIVRINGKDIPVNAESTDCLAAELLKMEYDIETCPSSHRRNSWGFTGDAERKKSVIRQFGIDVNELEAQICLRRSRSLSVYPGSKRLLEKSDSFENSTPRLNIVNEDACECNEKALENESDYAYLNESFTPEEKETKVNEEPETQVDTAMEKDTESFNLSNELLQNDSVGSSDERPCAETECKEISSLSTQTNQVDTVDNSNDDLGLNISFSDPTPVPDHSDIETTVKMPFNCEYSNSEWEKNNIPVGNEKAGFESSKYPKGSVWDKIRLKNSKNKKCQKDKKCVKTKKAKKSTKQTFCNNSSIDMNSAVVKPNAAIRNTRGFKKPRLKPKECTSLKVIECLKHVNIGKSKDQRKQNDVDKHPTDSHSSFSEIRDMSNNFSITDKANGQNNSLSIDERCAKNNGEATISNANQTFRNIIHHEVLKDHGAESKLGVQEPEIKKIVQNHTLYATVPPLTQSQINRKDVSVEESQALRTHTLRTIDQFNFKQFNPPFDSERRISPVKSQIVQWESTLSAENPKSSVKRTNTSESEQVSIKEKLAFWENASKTERKPSTQNSLENNRKISLLDNKKTFNSVESNTNAVRNDLHNLQGPGGRPTIPLEVTGEKTEARNSINKQTNLAAKKDIDYKLTPELQLGDRKIRKRSFSDPGVSEAATCQKRDFPDIPSLESSLTGNFISSSDDNLEHYLTDDSFDSGEDFAQNSTGDEYIDDEISGSASEYWGDLGVLKGLKVAQCSIEDSFPANEFLENQLLLKSFPDECKVFGIAVYYGYVAEKNRFQVYTGDAGFGNLSVSMQGFRRHDVSLVSVAYVRKDIYEVTYQVMTTGYYLIFVRWMDKEIPGSPFVCKVTF